MGKDFRVDACPNCGHTPKEPGFYLPRQKQTIFDCLLSGYPHTGSSVEKLSKNLGITEAAVRAHVIEMRIILNKNESDWTITSVFVGRSKRMYILRKKDVEDYFQPNLL